jgi:hypothetical protein
MEEMSSSIPATPAEGLPAASTNNVDLTKTKSASNSTLQSALDVRIDVKGAYIVDDDDRGDEDVEVEWEDEEDYQHDSSDIRLPHHHNVVSHMAVDVSYIWCFYIPFLTSDER